MFFLLFSELLILNYSKFSKTLFLICSGLCHKQYIDALFKNFAYFCTFYYSCSLTVLLKESYLYLIRAGD